MSLQHTHIAELSQATGVTVSVIRNADELVAIADPYDRLLESCGPWTWPARSGWALPMLDAWARGRQRGDGANSLFLLLAHRHGKLIGALPLQLCGQRRGPLSLNRLYAMGVLPGSSIGAARPVVAVEATESLSEVLRAFLDFIFAIEPMVWDVLELEGCLPTSRELEALDANWPWWKRSLGTLEACAIELPADSDTRKKWLPGSSRYHSEVRRRRRKAERDHGKCDFYVDDKIDSSCWDAIAGMHLRRQEAIKATGRDRYSVFDDALEGPALRAAMRWAEDHGIARYYRLEINGELAAFQIGTAVDDHLYLSVMGFEPEFYAYAPFKILMDDIVRDALDNDFQVIDCGVGRTATKQDYCNSISPTAKRVLLHPSLRASVRAQTWDGVKAIWNRARNIVNRSDS